MEGEEPDGIPSRFTVERVLAARDDGVSVTFTLSLLYSAQESHSSLFHEKERRRCHGRWACRQHPQLCDVAESLQGLH